MNQGPSNPYLRTRILTANAQELRLMLFEGAIKFCRQAKQHLADQNLETGHNLLLKAQKIVLELSTSLDHQQAPDLCSKLGALYMYIYRRLVDANTNHDPQALDEAIQLLEYDKHTWQMLIEHVAQQEHGPPLPAPPLAAGHDPQPTFNGLSVNG